MKTIISMRGTRTFAGPGMYAIDAEAETRTDSGETLYVHINDYDSFRHYTVSKTSICDFMTGESAEDPDAKFTEEYTSLKETKDSEYTKVFKTLSAMASQIGKDLDSK